jgi:MtN3 and saliva related transmembrane protein
MLVPLDILGLCAGTLTTAAFIPQVYRLWRTRSTQDISLPMVLIFIAGVVLWLIYGLWAGALAIIVANLVTLLLWFIILGLKWRHG